MRRDGLAVALLATTVAQAMATLAVFGLPILAPKVGADLGVPTHWLGLHVAILYLHAAVVSALAAGLLRRIGPACATIAALATCAVGLLLPAVTGLAGAALGAALIGVGYGLTNPAASEVLARVTPPQRRNLVFSLKQTGVPLGGTLAGLALPALSLALGWRAALLIAAGGVGLVALLLLPLRAVWDGGRDPRARLIDRQPLAGLTSGSVLRALAVIGALYAAVQLSFASYLVAMLVEEFGWTAQSAGAAAAAVQVSGALGRLAWAAVADRGGRGRWVLGITGLGTGLGLLALLPAGMDGVRDAVLLVLLCLIGACSLGWNGVLLAEAARSGPAGNAGAGVGAVLSVTFMGVILGPPLLGLAVFGFGSYSAAFAASAAVALAGAALSLGSNTRSRAG